MYAELFQGKVRVKFFGSFTNDDVIKAIKSLKENHFQVDMIVEENGRLRKIDDENFGFVFVGRRPN